MTDKKNNCYTAIDNIFEKYKDNHYIQQRIYNHIVNYLPNTLENECKNYEKRQNLNISLSQEQQIFIQVFLSKNKYYYLNNNNFFYKYDGTNYYVIKEDEIIHKLLSAISNEGLLLQWKHKTKINVLKQIKERNLFTSIPETDTIQNVLNSLYPSIFSSKNAAKYFLTVIGDNILKKNTNLIFLVNPNMKQFLNELNDTSIISIGHNNIINNFMTKYHENHLYENCRLIKINDNFSYQYCRDILKKIGLNLLCLSVHYSKRYENSDNFINTNYDEILSNYTYTLKNITQSQIIEKFINECIDKTNDSYGIEWKNLHFIWKQFLSNNNLPNVVFSNTLKNYLITIFSYEKDNDFFKGITSKYLPIYKDFIKFWDTTINTSNLDEFENELEVDEISSLFKYWSKSKNNLSEENIIKILKHFFSNIEIIEDKYILNITSNLWDKNNDISNSFTYVKEQIKIEQKMTLISFDDIYTYYKNYCNRNSIKFIVSKRYFEKYLYHNFSEYILYEKFIKIEWLNI